jgi:hypothetical protein
MVDSLRVNLIVVENNSGATSAAQRLVVRRYTAMSEFVFPQNFGEPTKLALEPSQSVSKPAKKASRSIVAPTPVPYFRPKWTRRASFIP